MKKQWKRILTGLAVLVFCVGRLSGTAAAEEATENGFYGALHVEGTGLAAEDGTPVQLKGVSSHGLGWFPDYVNDEMIAQVKQWGANVFRLAMYTAEYNGYCTSDENQKNHLKSLIDTGVRAAVDNDMYVIIDWHILSDGNPHTYKEEAKKFFAEMAEKYAEIPNVIYEICNEPNGGVSWGQIKEYALEIIPVIRQYAKDAVIIVGTPTWSQDVDQAADNPITEYENIVYALHFYADTHRQSLRTKCIYAFGKGLPMFVSEYGICDASGGGNINEAEADMWIEFLNNRGISHVIWNLSNKSETCAMIKSSSNKKSNLTQEDLSDSGKWFVKMMGSPVGTPVPTEAPVQIPTVTPVVTPAVTEMPQVTQAPQPQVTTVPTPQPQVTQMPQLTQIPHPTVPAPCVEECSGYRVTFTVYNIWNGGLVGEIKIENTGTEVIEDWYLKYRMNNNISNLWNGAVYTHNDAEYVVKHAGWNQDIPAGGSVQFGFVADGEYTGYPTGFEILKKSMEPTRQTYTVEYILYSDWGNGFNGAMLITNTSDTVIEDWTMELDFGRTITEIWNARVTSQENGHYVIDNAGYNSVIWPGQTVHVGFNGTSGTPETVMQNYCLYSRVTAE